VAERAALAADECWSVARAQGPSVGRRVLWRKLRHDPELLRTRPVLGALRRFYVPSRENTLPPTPACATPVAEPEPTPSLDPQALIERLLRDLPKLHYLSEEAAQWLCEHGTPAIAGPISWAVPPQVIRYLALAVEPGDLTVETGSGQSTVAFAILGAHHTCITVDEYCVDATRKYLDTIGVPPDKVTFLLGSSDAILPALQVSERFDFAYIDGEHGYPFPALDWHYIDPHLKVGGIMGFDNAEVPSVSNHCEFLELNRTYRMVQNISEPVLGTYGAYFYEKLTDQDRGSGSQQYNHHRVVGMFPANSHDPVWPWT
jgi:predicted O-methyltransferase YrrM